MTEAASSTAPTTDEGFAEFPGSYAMLSHIPVQISDGQIYTDRLWAKDLDLHMRYLPALTLVSPLDTTGKHDGWDPVASDAIRHVALPMNKGWPRTILNMPRVRRIVSEVARTHDLLHTGLAGWPFPLSFYLFGERQKSDFVWFNVTESIPWAGDRGPVGWIGPWLDRYAHRVIQASDLRLYTNPGFRDYFNQPSHDGMINPASWIDADFVASEEMVTSRPQRLGSAVPKFLFAGRLTHEKGLDLLMDALNAYPADAPSFQLDLIGEGPLIAALKAFAQSRRGPIVNVLPVRPYGPEFFALLDEYSLLVVPTRSSEQPRIIYDAAIRGVPVLASDTPGNLSVISDALGLRFASGDVHALTKALGDAAADQGVLFDTGHRAYRALSSYTHEEMHRQRSHYLRDAYLAERHRRTENT
ncbi:MAG: glycosyltransferase [Pseudomonadota bacterium]